MLLKLGKRAQTTAEYAILIALVVAAVLAMQVYVKRGVQGRVRDAVDDLARQTSTIGSTDQYEPYYLQSDATSTQSAADTDTLQQGGGVDRVTTSTSSATRDQTMGWSR